MPTLHWTCPFTQRLAGIVVTTLLLSACDVAPDASSIKLADTDADAALPNGFSEVCRSDEECAERLGCFCGICTAACDVEQDCRALSPSARCVGSFPLSAGCMHPSATLGMDTRVCAITCGDHSEYDDGDDDACGALGHAAVCSAQWCRRPIARSVLDGSDSRSCADRDDELMRIFAPALDVADRTCATASDCIFKRIVNACYGDECIRTYVSRKGEDQLQTALSSLENMYCAEVFDAGCAGPGLRPSCPWFGVAACVDGQCVEKR